MTNERPSAQMAAALDAADLLAGFREQFIRPPAHVRDNVVYFAGNSLGLQPLEARGRIHDVLDDWAELAVRGWTGASPRWLDFNRELSEASATIVGAQFDEVSVSGTLTGNLHALLTSFYRPQASRFKILVEPRLFPSDRYALASHVGWHGFDPEAAILEPPPHADDAMLLELIDRDGPELSLVLLGGINYYSGRLFDMAAISRAARKHGCVVGLDLAHAAGNVPVKLHDWDVDFAVWCGYKYLNGGPGAPGGLFVHQRHFADPSLPRLAGWWGHRHQTRFSMPPAFDPEPGAAGWEISTPSILALAPLRASLALHAAAGMQALRAKSLRLSAFLAESIRDKAGDLVEIVTPDLPDSRGAQLSLRVREGGRRVFDKLQEADIVCDWREPDAIRAAPVPMYNTFSEAYRFAVVLGAAVHDA